MCKPYTRTGDFRARPVHLAAPSVRRCGPQVRAQEGPAGVPGPPGPGLDGPGSPVTKRSTFCHVLSRWRVGREEGRKRHSQTLNLDLSLPDRGLLLGLESSMLREQCFESIASRGAYVKMTFSSAPRSASAAERPDISRRSPSLPGHRPARRSHHPRADLTNRRRIEIL